MVDFKKKNKPRGETTKECSICASLYKSRSGRSKYCKDCVKHAEYYHKMLNVDWRLRKLVAAAKFRAKAKNVSFSLASEDILDLWEKQNGCCALTGFVFDLTAWGNKGQVNPKAPSIDRIVPSEGYVLENVRLVTYHMNCALTEFGEETFKEMALSYLKFNKRGVN